MWLRPGATIRFPVKSEPCSTLNSDLGTAASALKDLGIGVYGYVEDSAQKVTLIPSGRAAPPPTRQLKAVTFNIQAGGKQFARVLQELRRLDPDVVLLQECSVDSARKLGAALGMNVAIGGNWKVILSRFPIDSARALNYDIGHTERFTEAYKTWQGEAFEVRGLLDATIDDGGRKIDVIDTHFSTSNPGKPGWQVREADGLTRYVKALTASGKSVVAAGDENFDNNKLNQGTADPAVASAVRRLDSALQNAWTSGPSSVRIHGRKISPQQALDEINSGIVKKGSARWNELMNARAGVTYLGLGARIDNFLVSRDLTVDWTMVDQDPRASDHQPVETQVSLPPVG